MVRQILVILLLFVSNVLQAQLSDFDAIDFKQADSVAAVYKGKDLTNLPLLAHQLTSTLPTEVEKFRAIYTWVCTNIENDYHYYLKSRKFRKKYKNDSTALAQWNRGFMVKVFQKLLKDQSTVCTGYAYLVKTLSLLGGINCKIVGGYGRTPASNVMEASVPNHSWNAVELNGKWYLCDATWDAGLVHRASYKFLPDYKGDYFLASPELFAKNHYPLEKDWLLIDHGFSFDDFLQGPLVYKTSFNHQLIPVMPSSMTLQLKKFDEVVFTFKAPNTINLEKLDLVLRSGNNVSKVRTTKSRNQAGLLELTCAFPHAGLFDLDVKLDAEVLITYTVHVKKK